MTWTDDLPPATDWQPALGAHRLLGCGHGAALVRPNGDIDWWCPERFEAPPMLWSLLDADGGTARWRAAETAEWDETPAGPTARSEVRIDGRRVQTWDGLVRSRGSSILVRLVRCEDGDGPVTLTHELSAGGFDAPDEVWDATSASSASLRIVGGKEHRLAGRSILSTVVAGDRWSGIGIIHAHAASFVEHADLEQMLIEADRADHAQKQRVRLPRHHPERAMDALRVLHALTDRDAGAPVASPTTSVPEAIGGDRQFDYRYTWLRDSANAIAVAALLGHVEVAADYLEFVARMLERTGGHLDPVSTTSGGPVPLERIVPDVAGWAGAQPIRVGNAAAGQVQLDAVTCVIEAVWVLMESGGRLTKRAVSTVEQLAAMLASAPSGRSSGVWELRTPRFLVSEELARWVGLDQAIRLSRRRRPWLRRTEWAAARDQARARVESAFDPETGMMRQSFDETDVVPDAASLLVAINGFFEPHDPRLRRIVHTTVSALETGAFLRRYDDADDGFHGREGAFLPASWWAVSALAIIGDIDEAERRADEMCRRLPRLLPEEWDVERDAGLGNTPLLWSHTEAARALHQLRIARIRRRTGRIGVAIWRLGRFARVRFATRNVSLTRVKSR